MNAYYPYGKIIQDLSTSSTYGKNNYKYNGKELQTDMELGWLDYGARMLPTSHPIWFVPDPLAEKYYSYSPYNYCLNNPIMFIDPNGMWVDDGDRISTNNPEEITAFMNQMKATSASGMVEGFTNSVKNFLGLNIHKDDPHYEKKKEIAMQNVVKTTEAIEGATDIMSFFIPGSSLIEFWLSVQYDQTITAGMLLFAAVDVATLGKGGGAKGAYKSTSIALRSALSKRVWKKGLYGSGVSIS